jgi:hypothetical protein
LNVFGMPEGPVFVNGLEATVGGAGELLGQVADFVGQAAELLEGLKGLLDAIAGIIGSLLIDAGLEWLIGGGVAFGFVALGPVVVLTALHQALTRVAMWCWWRQCWW